MLAILLSAGLSVGVAMADEAGLTGLQIMQQCAAKYAGDDQRSRFGVIIRDGNGNIKSNYEYLRIWKDFKGHEGVADKMILFTIFPPEAEGASFMRVEYLPELGRVVDQWIYLPVLKKIRRVTVRNPGDSFLNSNLTYADVSHRALEQDEHHFKGVKEVKGLSFYVVESIPKEANPQYGKRVFWFSKGDNWEQCNTVRIDYHDQQGQPIKDQFIKWQQVDGAWVWQHVLVRSFVNHTMSEFTVSQVSVNTGLENELFSERTLIKGPVAVPKLPSQDQGAKKQADLPPN